jgi:hypothetical protein
VGNLSADAAGPTGDKGDLVSEADLTVHRCCSIVDLLRDT